MQRILSIVAVVILLASTGHTRPAAAQNEPECEVPANAIVAENCQPGTESWIVRELDESIEGYAWPESAAAGETLNFYIRTDAPHYTLSIFRTGYYGGLGARLINRVENLESNPQPTCERNRQTGLISCANWSPTYSFVVPDDWVSGIFLAVLQRVDTGGANSFTFTIRDDRRKAALLFQQSTFTYQAYNRYGGKSSYHYADGDDCPTIAGQPRAVAVSLRRPLDPDGGDMLTGNSGNTYFVAEFPMVRWLEAQGYDVSYVTNFDVHQYGKAGARNGLLDHRVFLSVGHDEYWSQEVRDAITAARDAGVHIGIFSANTAYWRVRLENDPYTASPDSVMAVYKTTQSGVEDPSGIHTGTWRDPEGVNNPENELLGVMYIGDNDQRSFSIRVSAEQAADRIYRHTDLQTMPAGTYARIGAGTVGWEWDAVADNGHSPAGLQILAGSPVYGMLLQDAGNAANGNVGQAEANATRYTTPSGAIVFASGTIQWSHGLGSEGLLSLPADPYVVQITYNILSDMGVQPATPADSLILEGAEDESDGGRLVSGAKFLSAADRTPPTISNVAVSVQDSRVTITWETATDAQGEIWLGSKTGAVNSRQRRTVTREFARQHSATLNLTPGQTYYMRVVAIDALEEVAISDEQRIDVGGSFTARLRNSLALGEKVHGVTCWARANPAPAVGVGALAVLAVGFVGVQGFRLVRRRTRRR